MNLENKRILVTGSSQGIGRGCALELAREGADVAVNYRTHRAEAEEVAEEIRAMGRKALVFQADVAEPTAVEDMIRGVVKEWGGLDGFISNAVYSDRELMIEADMEGFRRTIDVTMWGAFHGVRAAALQMVEQGNGGSIIVVSSPHAYVPIPKAMAYNMAKAAVDHMARTAAIELSAHRIRVNIIHPGWIDTPGERKFFTEKELEEGAKSIPWKRLGTPREMGRLAAFMMSDDCDYMTGSSVLMDGGITLPRWSGGEKGQ